MMRALGLCVLIGCGVPPLKLALHLDTTGDQACPSTDCQDIDISCGAVESIRIFDPLHPSAPYLSQCQPVVKTNKNNLCSIVQNTLDQTAELPDQTLAVEVVIYPAGMIATDPTTQKLLCPTEAEGLAFDGTGMPMGSITMQDPSNPTVIRTFPPAIGGRAYWHPGDADVTVTLGCNDLSALDDRTCNGSQDINATATVYDFDTNTSVSPGVAMLLAVRMGEPVHVSGGIDIEVAMTPGASAVLDKVTDGPPPTWGAHVDLNFQKHACLEVFEETTQTTATVTCKDVASPTSVDITGFRLDKVQLDGILSGVLHSSTVPHGGLTIGVVRQDNNGAKDRVVTALAPDNVTMPTIHYLDADGMTDSGRTSTSESGIFVAGTSSVDVAPFGTHFSTRDATNKTVTAVGGNVDDKITIVVLSSTTTPNQ